MVKLLQNKISECIGLENFDYLVSIPTGGLIVTSALAIETVKPLIYVRNKPKDHGTSKSLEGSFEQGKKALMIDDVATTGGSVVNALKPIKDAGIEITDAPSILLIITNASVIAIPASLIGFNALTTELPVVATSSIIKAFFPCSKLPSSDFDVP